MEEARRRDHAADYLIRAKHNRKLVGGEKRWDSVASQEPLGHIEFILEASPQRKARKVSQTLTAQRVTLPKKKANQHSKSPLFLRKKKTHPQVKKPLFGDY
jgi:hypothetical protein